MAEMRYHVRLSRGRALLAALTGHAIEASAGQVRAVPGDYADGLRPCCRSAPGGGHLAGCIATPVMRAELARQETRRAAPMIPSRIWPP